MSIRQRKSGPLASAVSGVGDCEQRRDGPTCMDCLALGLVHYWLTCPLVLCYFSKMGERG